MANYGFFNSKNLDRTYTAEDFSGYLSHLICNGILDTYGDCFAMTADGLTIQIGTGRAWIDGHYFLNSSSETLDLSQFVDESLNRYVIIGISCDTSEDARLCQFETLSGTPSNAPEIPEFTDTENKTYLTLAAVYLEAAADTITNSNITDYRSDESKCGYVRCILGKCKVTEMMEQIEQMYAEITDLTSKAEALQTRMTYLTGDITDLGKCGSDVYYAIYSNGKTLLHGVGSTYNYNYAMANLHSVFHEMQEIKNVMIANGVTSIGSCLFYGCENLVSLSFPDSLTSVGAYAFCNTELEELTIPVSVLHVYGRAFSSCTCLTTAYCEAAALGLAAFDSCTSLTDFTIAKSCTAFDKQLFSGCTALTTLQYEGTLAEWETIEKDDEWDTDATGAHGNLEKIQCTDGYLQWDSENQEWAEVTENA